ncbi:MAG: hypothetical protein UT66_C0057G0005 [candidate division CPR2 bacterium GW2011_GWC1_39_9]|nr:MAG: hypothetical protein UT66_C0057G0005 [candidate division CPR2 bacterium GW2011_GWC1_39_9]
MFDALITLVVYLIVFAIIAAVLKAFGIPTIVTGLLGLAFFIYQMPLIIEAFRELIALIAFIVSSIIGIIT